MRTLSSLLLTAIFGATLMSCDPPCVTRGNQVIVLGDSYMNLGDAAAMPHRYVEELARADGSLASSESYRSYAVPGTSMTTGQIPSQLTQAIQANPDIKVTIMTGGGNDVLINHRECLLDGSSRNAGCQQVIRDAIRAAEGMMQTAANAGIPDVVYFFYPHVVPGLLTGPDPNEILDYAYPLVKASCDGASQLTQGKVRCHFIDMRPLFEGREAQYTKSDGIHPTAAGARVIGQAIWQKMEQNCIGQGPNAGCCAR